MFKSSSWAVAGLVAASLGLAGCNGKKAEAPADLVLTHGTVYTVNDQNAVVQAVAVRNGAIVFVGTDAGAKAFIGPKTKVEDLGGKAVFPGFTDSHVHLPDGGAGIRGLALGSIMDVKTVLADVKAYADANPDLPVIFGAGWELSLFPDANPSKALLDAIVPDRPVVLGAADGHNSWVNTKALELAGITKDTKDPINGHIEHDADGNPSGTLREAAQALVMSIVPQPTEEDAEKNIEAGMHFQLSNGITSSIDAAIMADQNEAAYLKLSENPDLPQRMRVCLLAAKAMVTSVVTPENAAETVKELDARRAQYRKHAKDRLNAECVKIFVDGVYENHTAAMIDPYVNAAEGPEYRGRPNLSPEALDAYVTDLDADGFQVHMHAIGDRAVRMALDAVEAAEKANGPKDRRHQIAHLEIVRPEDIKHFKPLNVTADLQTLWHFADEYITDLTVPFLQKDLQRWIYPAKSFKDAGARIVWGSDWPVSTSDPFQSMEVAVTRQDPNADPAKSEPPLVPEEALTVDDMIQALTRGGAYLMNQENIRGSLEVGKRGDMIIVDHDPYKVKPVDIGSIKVLETFIDGKTVFKRKAADS
ncbi:amidohydrolase [Kordiimonas marina]|uniref:amidohydrolase n=1 Tax=Kordiimonas marina TaxID=2872312 RepID=UPI001FF379FA|nr:amidohydrolase [Kordiimonas marina]MCJ9429133.1 amidohydrolase [Kordiimonas marina]